MDVQTRSEGGRIGKRKADDSGQDVHNERLSKRLSLLNLERNAPRLYVPVEAARSSNPASTNASTLHSLSSIPEPQSNNGDTPRSNTASTSSSSTRKHSSHTQDDVMHLDNTAHKVYIYNLDDELSSSDESSPPASPRMTMEKITFHPDLAAHLLSTRIPSQIRVNADGEFAGANMNNELVLYSIPSSLSVPEEKDSVRKAIIETRARARDKQRRERERERTAPIDIGSLSAGGTFHSGGATNGADIVPGIMYKADLEDIDAMDVD